MQADTKCPEYVESQHIPGIIRISKLHDCGLFFPDEKNAQSAGAAVTGDSASGQRFVNLVEVTVGGHGLHNGFMALVADTGVGDEENAVVQIVSAVKTVFDVVCQTLGVFSAILFATPILPSFTSMQGFRFRRFAPSAAAEEQRPPLTR